MWNNIIYGFLLIASTGTQCQSLGYPKERPENPLELPSSSNNDKINIITDSAKQQSTATAQDYLSPDEISSDDNEDKIITVPQDSQEHHHHGHQHHHGEDGAYNPHDDGTGWDIRKSIPGEPGRDYPTYVNVVDTSFTCGGKAAGYYADLETRCQIFRICTTGSVNAFNSFLCPNGSLFNQAVLTCDWWPNVDCQGSPSYYHKNNDIGKIPEGQQLMYEVQKMIEAPMLHPYKPVHEENYDDKSISNNHISDTNNYKNYQVTPDQKIVTVTEKYYTPTITFTTPKIQISTFESIITTGNPIVETPATDYLAPNIPNGKQFLDTKIQVGRDLFLSHSLSRNQSASSLHAQNIQPSGQIHLSKTLQTSPTLFTAGINVNSTAGTLHLSQVVQTNRAQPLYVSKVISSMQETINHSNSESKLPVFISQTISSGKNSNIVIPHAATSTKDGRNTLFTSEIIPQPQLTPIVDKQNTDLNNQLFLSQIGQNSWNMQTNQQTQLLTNEKNTQTVNINGAGPEKISLLKNSGQKQGGLLHSQQVLGTIQASSGFNVQNGAGITEIIPVNANTGGQVVGGLNLQNVPQISQINTNPGSLNGGTLNIQNEELQTGPQQFGIQQETGEQKQTSVQNIGFQQSTGEIQKQIELQQSSGLQKTITQTESPAIQAVTEGFRNAGYSKDDAIQAIDKLIQTSGQQGIQIENNNNKNFGQGKLDVRFKNGKEEQSEINKQTFTEISKSIELPGSTQGQAQQNFGLQNIGSGVVQHYGRILNQGNEQGATGSHNFGIDNQNFHYQNQNQFENQRNQFSEHFNQNAQNQGLHNFVLQAQGIQNSGFKELTSGFNNQGLKLDTQNLGFQNQGNQPNFGLHGQSLQNSFNSQNSFNLNRGVTDGSQDLGFQNQGFQSNFALQSQIPQNGFDLNKGFTSESQNQNLGTLNFGLQVPYMQNAFSNQNGFISNQNRDAGVSSPNYHEQNYQNFNYHTKNNEQNSNYEVSKNGAAQNYKGESLSQHTNGQAHSSYSGHNYAYKESTKVEVVPSLGFTLTDELGRASYASAIISGLVQEKRGASAENYAEQSILPSDVRHSSYQGPSSYLVPQSSVQHLPNDFKRQ